MIIYRYRPLNLNTIEGLINSTVYLANPGKYNDPFDSTGWFQLEHDAPFWVNVLNKQFIDPRTVDYGNIVDKLLKIPEMGALSLALQADADQDWRIASNVYNQVLAAEEQESDITTLNELSNRVFMCCFSQKQNSILMWSHYSDNHRGIVLGYEISKTQKQIGSRTFYNVSTADGRLPPSSDLILPVEYDEKPLQFQISGGLIGEQLYRLLTYKFKEWEYEKEFRLILIPEDKRVGQWKDDASLKLARKSLKEVIFGLRSSEKDRELVYSIVREHYKGQDVVFKQCIKKQGRLAFARWLGPDELF